MIESVELERRAGSLGVSMEAIELDYLLHHVLAHIAEVAGELVFRGGTALARIYWPDFRISEDLDFIVTGSGAGVERSLRRATDLASESTGLELQVEHRGFHDDRARTFVRWSGAWSSGGELLLDVVREILANKWMMLDTRDEPRDLFDLWWGLTRETVELASVADAHRASYGYLPLEQQLNRAGRLAARWEQRLGHQIGDLPRFEDAMTAVRKRFEAWKNGPGGHGGPSLLRGDSPRR